MACVGKASFKNSQLFPRPVTLVALTSGPVPIAFPGNITIPANANRTYLLIRNESTTDAIRYSYPLSPGTFLLFPKEGINIDSPQAVTVETVTGAVNISIDEGSG